MGIWRQTTNSNKEWIFALRRPGFSQNRKAKKQKESARVTGEIAG